MKAYASLARGDLGCEQVPPAEQPPKASSNLLIITSFFSSGILQAICACWAVLPKGAVDGLDSRVDAPAVDGRVDAPAVVPAVEGRFVVNLEVALEGRLRCERAVLGRDGGLDGSCITGLPTSSSLSLAAGIRLLPAVPGRRCGALLGRESLPVIKEAWHFAELGLEDMEDAGKPCGL